MTYPSSTQRSTNWWIIGGCGGALVLVALCACGFLVLGGSALLSIGTPPPVISHVTLTPSQSASPPPPKQLSPSPAETPVPSLTDTPVPKPINTPTPIPLGAFTNPVPLGTGITVSNEPLKNLQMSATVLEVLRGSEANELAKSVSYMIDKDGYVGPRDLIENQEYFAVKVKLVLESGPLNETYPLYSGMHFSLRYEEAGNDIWCDNVTDILHEGYPPLEGEGWLFFRIREGTEPLLYFQPELMVSEVVGFRTHGAYLALTQQ